MSGEDFETLEEYLAYGIAVRLGRFDACMRLLTETERAAFVLEARAETFDVVDDRTGIDDALARLERCATEAMATVGGPPIDADHARTWAHETLRRFGNTPGTT